MNIHIAVPVVSPYGNHCSVMWALQLVAMKKAGVISYSINCLPPTSAGRNALVHSFLKTKDDYILFIDTDTMPPLDGLTRLQDCCLQYDIASGLYFEKRHAQGPVAYPKLLTHTDGKPIWERLQKWDGSIIPVEAVGMGFCMIPRKVFETIDEPYFSYTFDEKGLLQVGEDMNFCKKARAAGFTIGLDTGCRCVHINDGVPITAPKSSQQKPIVD